MLLSDLVARTDLGLRVLHAADGALDRTVRWLYTTDLLDPARYLGGGELVITGLVWRRTPADSDRFVAAVAGAGAIALAAGDAVFGEIPDDLVDACRRHDLVLLAVPVDVSFAALTEAVLTALTAARGDRLAHTLGRQRQLLSAVAGGVGLDELVGQVAEATGRTCRVLTAGGATVAGPALPEAERDAVVTAFLSGPRLPVHTDRHALFPVVPGSARVTSWFVAVEAAAGGTPAEKDPEVADTMGELAAIAAMDRARRRERTTATRPIADDALARIAAGEGDHSETRVRMSQAGIDASGGVQMVVLRAVGDASPAETAYTILADALTGAAGTALGVHAGAAVALLPAPGGADRLAPVLEVLRRLAPGLGTTRLLVGAGRPAGPEALSGAWGEAAHACELAAAGSDPVSVSRVADLTSHVALLAGVPDTIRRAFADQVLGPVRDYDARSGAGLCATLEEFLECSGSWSRTAARLHLHVNTVRYRIGRVEELTGRRLGHFPDRVDLYLALRAR